MQQLIEQIKSKSGLSNDEIGALVTKKQEELQGLLSQEGALHIVANELGISMRDFYHKKNTIKTLIPGMRTFEIGGVITRIFPVKSFEKDGRKGSVGSFSLQDDSGTIRVVCWGEQTSLLATLSEGDNISIQNARIQARQQGETEVHVLPTTRLIKVTSQNATARKLLCAVSEKDKALSVYGTIVALYDLRYFEQCPLCRKRLSKQEAQWVCQKHGPQQPYYGYMLSLILDDGTATMRVILFSRQVEQLLGKEEQQILELRENTAHLVALRKQFLGRTIMLTGGVYQNSFFPRLELHVSKVVFPTPDEVLIHLEHIEQ